MSGATVAHKDSLPRFFQRRRCLCKFKTCGAPVRSECREMNRIKPHRVWVGHAGDSRAFKEILDAGIQAVVQLAAEEQTVAYPRELIYCRFPLVDGNGNKPLLLNLAMHSVATLIERRVPTLVCCGGAVSRSPAIVAAALSLALPTGLDECLKDVTRSHPSDVSPALWDEIRQVREQIVADSVCGPK